MASFSETDLHSVGFDGEFVEKPPKEFQSECPVCLLLLRKPYIVSCCGYSFCYVCIDKIKINNASCPCCKEEEFNFFPNKGLKRSLYEFNTYCSNRKKGCQWIGNLGQLDSHLNRDPKKEREELEGCQFVSIKCSHCSQSFLCSRIKDHKQHECLMRPYTCSHCKTFESTYGEVTTSHWTECGFFPTPCRCGQTLQRQLFDDHIANVCPETIVDCDFKHFGCRARLPRKDLQRHVSENLATHMGELTRLVVRLQAENEHLKRELQCLRVHTPTPALNLIMNNLERYKRKGTSWLSPSFYAQGYKLRLQVYVNNHGDDGSLCTTIFVCLMQGKFDESLQWPFKGTIVVELLKEDTQSCSVMYTGRIVHESKRVTTGNVIFGRGVTAVHPEHMKFVQNDRLLFRIPAVQQLSITDHADRSSLSERLVCMHHRCVILPWRTRTQVGCLSFIPYYSTSLPDALRLIKPPLHSQYSMHR